MNNEAPQRDALPLPDYDHIPTGSLQHRIRTLDADGIQQLLAYERQHANRPLVVRILESRLDELTRGAEPSAGSPTAPAPEAAPAAQPTQTVSPATAGPPVNPPSHGTPTNPAQPRATG
jgi:hypothetical protein